jgi:cbb3-type cytochrome c oxidase subunit III
MQGILSKRATVLAILVIIAWAVVPPLARAADSSSHTNEVSSGAAPASAEKIKRGHSLFDRNCSHCHGDDARGDEGPSLYNLALSDAKIAKRIKEGIKGEMPKFGGKFNDADIAALTAYLRTFKS